MVRAFAGLLVLHGLIHLVGFAKAFRFADLPQLVRPISPALGVMWLLAAGLFVVAAVMLLASPRWWWAIAAAGLVLSMVVIVPSWGDAKFGAAVNVLVLAGVVIGTAWAGPTSLSTRYDRDVHAGLDRRPGAAVVTESDLTPLPAVVQRYLRQAGVVGRPHVWHLRVRMRGRIRDGRNGAWMSFEAEQHNFFDRPSRLFYMTASRSGMPIQGYHRYDGPEATMRIKVLGLVPVLDVSGADMTRAETVTMFNDMCVMAPATLVSRAVTWEPVDDRTVRAAFTNAGHTIRAELTFNEAGDLADFQSDDRGQASADGTTMTPTRWSTPIARYATFGAYHLAAAGDARWHDGGGDPYPYIEFVITAIDYN